MFAAPLVARDQEKSANSALDCPVQSRIQPGAWRWTKIERAGKTGLANLTSWRIA